MKERTVRPVLNPLPQAPKALDSKNDTNSPLSAPIKPVGNPIRRFPSQLPPLPLASSATPVPEASSIQEVAERGRPEFISRPRPAITTSHLTSTVNPAIDSNVQLQFWGFDDEELNKQVMVNSELESLETPVAIPSSQVHNIKEPVNNTESILEPAPRLIEVREQDPGKNYFYNIPIRGEKILFLLEVSADMTISAKGAVLSLENELRRVVNSLQDNQLFNIWVFQKHRISRCEPDYMQASNANKAFSLLWLRGHYQYLGKQEIIEDNKPAGYPQSHPSVSSLRWATPLFLGLYSYPDEIFFVASEWQRNAPSPEALDAIRSWTRDKQTRWRAAYEETLNWLEDDNRVRQVQGLPPRAVISLKPIIAKRHPNVDHPPAILQKADSTLVKELDEIIYAKGLENRLSLNTILYSPKLQVRIEDIHKFSSLSRKYLGRFVLVENNGEVREL